MAYLPGPSSAPNSPDLPGPSTAPISLSKSEENFSRLGLLIMTVCSDLFRDILSRHIQPGNLTGELNNNKNTLLKILKIPKHKQLLYPSSAGQSVYAKDMDLSLLYILLRNICGIPSHQAGWGNTPNHGDNSLAARIERIREQKNAIASHAEVGEVDDTNFQDIWNNLQVDIVNIEMTLIGGNMYERAVNRLLSCDLSSSKAKEHIEEFKRLCEKIEEAQSQTRQFHSWKKARINSLTMRQSAIKRKLIGASASKKARIGRLEKQQSSATSDIKEHITWHLPVTSRKLEDEFNSVIATIRGKLSSSSFADEILQNEGISGFLDEIQSLSTVVWVTNNRGVCQIPSALHVFEVEVRIKNGEVREKIPEFADSFFKSNNDYSPHVILVSSRSISIIEAKLKVYKKYKDNYTLYNTFIHHINDDNDELSKLSAFYKASLFLERVDSMTKSIQLNNVRGMVLDELTFIFTKDDLQQACFEAILKKDETVIGSVRHDSYYCESEATAKKLKQSLVYKAIQKICELLGFAIRRVVYSYHQDKYHSRLGNTLPSEIYSGILIQAVMNHISDDLFISEAKETSGSLPLSVDVNCRKWRQEIAEAVFKRVTDKKKEIVDTIVEICRQTEEKLLDVCTILRNFTESCRPIQLITLVHEWKKRAILEESELRNVSSVLKYIVGRKDNKQCMKVFLERNDENAEEFIKNCGETLSLSENITYEFVNVNDKLEQMKREIKDIKQREKNADPIPLPVKKSMKECVDSNAEIIYSKYSIVVGIGLSNVLNRDQKETPCIVLYCLDKNLVPFGEKELPEELQGIPCDIREDIVMLGSCDNCIKNTLNPGCNIGSPFRGGSAGFLLNHPFKGFLTAAHVAVPNFGEFYKLDATDLNDTKRGEVKISHPYQSDDIVGEVEKCILGNYNKYGLDVAIVRNSSIHCSAGTTCGRKTLPIVEEECQSQNIVIKRGNATGVTKGVLSGEYGSARIDSIDNPGTSDTSYTRGAFYIFNNCYIIDDWKDDQPFFNLGDSGSGVFIIDKSNHSIKPLGIAFARHKLNSITLVCKIKDIMDNFGLSIYQDDEFESCMFKALEDEEQMETD